jgi:hypothetical protein
VVISAAGRGKLGCLLTLLLFVGIIYFGRDVGEVYWRFYQFRDAVEQEAQYGGVRTDDEIRRRLMALADSLGLPEEAGRRLQVHRSANRLTIRTEYTEHIQVPLYKRDLKFTPSAEKGF